MKLLFIFLLLIYAATTTIVKSTNSILPIGCLNPLNCRYTEIIEKSTTTSSPPAAAAAAASSILTEEIKQQLKPCFQLEDRMELCQRCAKETKAINVFPLCCSNVDNVKEYCENYIYFGI